MSHYIPYNLKFLGEKLKLYESKYANHAPKEVVHEAQMLLKEMFDLQDQGYAQSYARFNNELNVVERLSAFILKNGAQIIKPNNFAKKNIKYGKKEIPLSTYLQKLFAEIDKDVDMQNVNPMLNDVLDYSKSLFRNHRSDTSYVFLLRDTLLPYFAFKVWQGSDENLYPWLIGRKWLSKFPSKTNLERGCTESDVQSQNFGNNDEAYEMMYVSLFSALEEENKNFNQFAKRVRFYVDEQISEFEPMKNSLVSLLSNIKTKKIMVVESGRFASIPLLLKSLDDRVDFRLFTTTPQFYGVYQNKYFTNAYDKNRLFETLTSQNDLFQFSSFKDGEFYVVETLDAETKNKAIKELRQFYHLLNENK